MADVDFAHKTVQALLTGQFQYNVGGSPSKHSGFCFCKKSPVLNDEPNRAMILHLVVTQGSGKTMDEINFSAKQKTSAPTTFEDLSARVKFLTGACIILFGANTALVKHLNIFLEKLKKNYLAIETRIVEDPTFTAKLLYAIDLRSQRWIQECMDAADICDVDDSIINFDNILR